MSAYALPGLLFPPANSFDFTKTMANEKCAATFDYSFDIVYDAEEKKMEYMDDDYSSHEEEEREEELDVEVFVKATNINILQLVSNNKQRSSSNKRKRNHRMISSSSASSSLSRSSASSAAENAVQVEVTVTFNGRTYQFEKSLGHIRQLYHELLDEDYENQQFNKKVPYLAELSNGSSVTNFALLYAEVDQYVPVVQRWLQKVFTIISPKHSSSLAYFLCEPFMLVHQQQNNANHFVNKKQQKRLPYRASSCPCCCRMEIITEEDEQ